MARNIISVILLIFSLIKYMKKDLRYGVDASLLFSFIFTLWGLDWLGIYDTYTRFHNGLDGHVCNSG